MLKVVFTAVLVIGIMSCHKSEVRELSPEEMASMLNYQRRSIQTALVLYADYHGRLPDNLDHLMMDGRLAADLGEGMSVAVNWSLNNYDVQYDPAGDTVVRINLGARERGVLGKRYDKSLLSISKSDIYTRNGIEGVGP